MKAYWRGKKRSIHTLVSAFFHWNVSAASLDQQGYRTERLPDLILPRHGRHQPSQDVIREIQQLVRRMLSFEAHLRPAIHEVVTALTDYSRRFPIS